MIDTQCQLYFLFSNLATTYCLISLAMTSIIMLNKNGESGLSYLLPDLEGEVFSFFPFRRISAVMLRYVPSIFNSFRGFIMKVNWIFSNAFSESIKMIMGFLQFILLMLCIMFIDLCLLNCSFTGMHLTWSSRIIF